MILDMTNSENSLWIRAACSLAFVALATFSTIDRLYWVNAGSGIAGGINGKHLPAELTPQCQGAWVEVRQVERAMDYRCSTIGGSIPFWPFYRPGTSEALHDYWQKRFRSVDTLPID